MTAVTYDMQKLDEAVGALALGMGSIQERLRGALGPLAQLRANGLYNKKLSAELDRILLGISFDNATKLSDDAARALASSIVELQAANWADAVYELEDKLQARAQ